METLANRALFPLLHCTALFSLLRCNVCGKNRVLSQGCKLVERGFLSAAANLSGPLFYDLMRKKGSPPGNSQAAKAADRIARWVRKDLGLNDPELQPNHGCRHSFVTIGREIGMDEAMSSAIVGHSHKDVHADYGDRPLSLMHRWMERFPRLQV